MALALVFLLGCGTEPSANGGFFPTADGVQQQADGLDVDDAADSPAPPDSLTDDLPDQMDTGFEPDSEEDVQPDLGSELDSETDAQPDIAETETVAPIEIADSPDADATDAVAGDIDTVNGQSDVDLVGTDVPVIDAETPETEEGSDAVAETDAVAVGTDALPAATDALAATDAIGTDALPAGTDAIAGTDSVQESDTAVAEDSESTDAATSDDAQTSDTGTTDQDTVQGSDIEPDPCLTVVCDDGDSCTTDSCIGGVCSHIQLAGCNHACSTSADCEVGKCQTSLHYCVQCVSNTDCASGERCLDYECEPAIPCSTDSICKPASQVCDTKAKFCVDCIGNADCAEGLTCKQNKCESATLCTSSKQCPGTELCETAKGYCVECLANVDCPLDEYCGSDRKCKPDICSTGHCFAGNYAVCSSTGSNYGVPKSCSDGNSCTADLCNPESGCVSVPVDIPCNDNSACTLIDICVGGSCIGGEQVTCKTTNSCQNMPVCDPMVGVCGAETPKADGTTCNDGGVCVLEGTCTAGACKVKKSLNCSDIDPASLDSCDPTEGCKHTWQDICNGMDDDLDGQTDNVSCSGLPCTCGLSGTVCKPGCTVCPDAGDLALSINDNGQQKVVCAHDYPAWGMPPAGTSHLVKNSDGTTSDTWTGLQWPQSLEDVGKTWSQAYSYCDNLAFAGYTDWRMPTLFELHSIIDFQLASKWDTSFFPTLANNVWTATPYLATSSSGVYKWSFNADSRLHGADATDKTFRTSCVRTQADQPPVQPRWTIIDDKVRKDEATGLMWAPTNEGGVQWQTAKQSCEALVAGGYDDWRLPTAREATTTFDPKSTVKPAETPALSSLPLVMYAPFSTKYYYRSIWTTTPYLTGTKSEYLVMSFGDDYYNTTAFNLEAREPTVGFVGAVCVRVAQ